LHFRLPGFIRIEKLAYDEFSWGKVAMASTAKVRVGENERHLNTYRYIRSDIIDFSRPTHDTLFVLSSGRNKRIQLKVKRLCDFLFSGIILLFLSPVLLIISLVIKLTSRGPVMFKQIRIGQIRNNGSNDYDGTVPKGSPFKIYKFRTMKVTAPAYAVTPSSSNDERITRIGKILRKTCADELPQLINVLKGDMSLVGPRPEMPFIVEKYDHLQARRLWAKPGITGLWQLHGSREKPIHEDLKFDIFYVKNWSLWLDTSILFKTIKFMFHAKNI
jgi:lipopolysaccharide/colanic/teichoic acid biosynthesis glycosyltransferase